MEVAAGLIIAEEVITSILEGGAVAGFALAKPTLPLKCTLSQFAKSPEEPSPDSLSRAKHTINVVNGSLYIFGGYTAPDQFAGNEMHIIKLSEKSNQSSRYHCVPAVAVDGETHAVPSARAGHSACAIGDKILVFGGTTAAHPTGTDAEKSTVWAFDTVSLQWKALDALAGPSSRTGHQAVVFEESLMIIHGGVSSDARLSDTWAFNVASNSWSQLPDLPQKTEQVSEASASLATANGALYLIAHSSDFTSTIHTLRLKGTTQAEWTTVEIPVTVPNPGPRPRAGAGLLPLLTGQGRTYLLYLFGASPQAQSSSDTEEELKKLWSGIWALQAPSAGGAYMKDALRSTIGLDSHESEWSEVDIIPREESGASEGKAHPGPRAFFGYSVVPGTKRLILWGGERPDGSFAGDGWVIDFQTPGLSGALKKIPGVGKLVRTEES